VNALNGNAIAAYHIGSTAIPSIVAKPIIDILPVVENIEMVDDRNAEMEELGYEALGEFGIADRRYFRKDDGAGKRTHHVHVFPHGSKQIERHVNFRDFMNEHPVWAEEYSKLKLKLIAKHPDSIECYMDGKDEFIKFIDSLAAIWRSDTETHQ
jgi:GrpB-like predicted nucleotidyltransferase (UPF0157 family)